MTTKTINYNLRNVNDYNCAFTKNGWKVIFPIIQIQDDDDYEDIEFIKDYEAAIKSVKGEILKHAEMISESNYAVGQWNKVVNSTFSKETKKLHDLVMGNNGCDELVFRLEVIDHCTIKVA